MVRQYAWEYDDSSAHSGSDIHVIRQLRRNKSKFRQRSAPLVTQNAPDLDDKKALLDPPTERTSQHGQQHQQRPPATHER